jgi:hypothetical protein
MSNIETVIQDIIRHNKKAWEMWPQSHGWTPREAADLLTQSRLDWMVSLSHCLNLWLVDPEPDEADGRLILAWANLGSLVEGSMKILLCLCYSDYAQNPVKRGGKDSDPDVLQLEQLRQFYVKHKVWSDREAGAWDKWVNHIQLRRNAIHAYEDKDIGTREEFFEDVRRYRELQGELDRMPHPPEEEG